MPGGNTAYEQAQADARKKAADRRNQARVQAQENSRRAAAKANSAKIIAAQNKREAESRRNAREKAREVSARAVASRAKANREQSARIVASENAKRATAKKNASRIQAAQNKAQAKREQKAEENRQDRNRQENEAAKATARKQAEEGRRDQEARNRAGETGSAQADANRRDREKREREIALQANEFASANRARELQLQSQEFASAQAGADARNLRLKKEREAGKESPTSLEKIATRIAKRASRTNLGQEDEAGMEFSSGLTMDDLKKMQEEAKTAAGAAYARKADDEGTKIIEEEIKKVEEKKKKTSDLIRVSGVKGDDESTKKAAENLIDRGVLKQHEQADKALKSFDRDAPKTRSEYMKQWMAKNTQFGTGIMAKLRAGHAFTLNEQARLLHKRSGGNVGLAQVILDNMKRGLFDTKKTKDDKKDDSLDLPVNDKGDSTEDVKSVTEDGSSDNKTVKGDGPSKIRAAKSGEDVFHGTNIPTAGYSQDQIDHFNERLRADIAAGDYKGANDAIFSIAYQKKGLGVKSGRSQGKGQGNHRVGAVQSGVWKLDNGPLWAEGQINSSNDEYRLRDPVTGELTGEVIRFSDSLGAMRGNATTKSVGRGGTEATGSKFKDADGNIITGDALTGGLSAVKQWGSTDSSIDTSTDTSDTSTAAGDRPDQPDERELAGPTTKELPAEANLSARMKAAAEKDSPYRDIAERQGLQWANERGMLNSEMASGAVWDRFLTHMKDIEGPTALAVERQGLENQRASNQFKLQEYMTGTQFDISMYGQEVKMYSQEVQNEFNAGQNELQRELSLAMQEIGIDSSLNQNRAQCSTRAVEWYGGEIVKLDEIRTDISSEEYNRRMRNLTSQYNAMKGSCSMYA